ncbi:hypothetical protein ALC62_12801 [Cyphomyrmex costatus]|uniref:Uncharacterized protein n=1 Tax=Cyphomyrmex costatus TaxID=456900 RepID=A0A151IAK5_9HYME|nr:hypothetical protein ALC62_12801 [Cyphomyrmex costatus]
MDCSETRAVARRENERRTRRLRNARESLEPLSTTNEARYIQGGEEGRLHFRDPRSGYTVIPRDVEGERKRAGLYNIGMYAGYAFARVSLKQRAGGSTLWSTMHLRLLNTTYYGKM